MNLIYLHGFNSSPNAKKAKLLTEYCQQHHPEMKVIVPDLNCSGEQVMNQLQTLLSQEKSAVIGSSLGGFYATLACHRFGCKTILLNPSLYPDRTLPRFLQRPLAEYSADEIVYQTQGGWQLKLQDFTWFQTHRPASLQHRSQLFIILKQGDDVIDYRVAEQYFLTQGVSASQLQIDAGGDHVVSDFAELLPKVMQVILS